MSLITITTDNLNNHHIKVSRAHSILFTRLDVMFFAFISMFHADDVMMSIVCKTT